MADEDSSNEGRYGSNDWVVREEKPLDAEMVVPMTEPIQEDDHLA